ncbi:MAG: enoyl-CoA hydratase/isomerase family protein, partial [Hyphomicrobiaceae bacterium]
MTQDTAPGTGSTEAPHLLTEIVDDSILVATLNRPDKLNAISSQMMDLLTKAVLTFRETPSLKVMLIRSAGRYFSAGADLRGGNQTIVSPANNANNSASTIRENHRLNLNNMQQLWDEMEHIEKPFVVA